MANTLKKAHEAISIYKNENDNMYKQLFTQEKDIRRLRLEYSKKTKAALIKEKKRARAMFGNEQEKKDPQRIEISTTKDKAEASMAPSSTTTSSSNLQASLPETAPIKFPLQADDAGKSQTLISGEKAIQKDILNSAEIEEEEGDDYSDPTFFEEHIEALLILMGIAVGCLFFKMVNQKKKL